MILRYSFDMTGEADLVDFGSEVDRRHPPSFPFCDQCGPFCLTPQDQLYLSFHPARNRKFEDSSLEGEGFELWVRWCTVVQRVIRLGTTHVMSWDYPQPS